MGLWLDAARVATAGNVVLLLGLSYVWLQNFDRFRSKHTLGLLVFSLLLLAENGLAAYYFSVDPSMRAWLAGSAPFAQRGMMALAVLEFGALLFLAWVTWD